MEFKEAQKILKSLTIGSLKEGYRGDAIQYAFFGLALDFLNRIEQNTKLIEQNTNSLILKEVIEVRKMVNLLQSRKPKQKRKPTKWNLFVAKYLKQGKTIKEASGDWKKKH